MSKITLAILLGCMMVLFAIGTAHAGVGVIADPGYEGVNTSDGGGPQNDNYTWTTFSGGSHLREETSASINWAIGQTQGSQSLVYNAGSNFSSWDVTVQNGWNNGSGHNPAGDILMAANTTYTFTCDVQTYGALFDGGGTNSDNWLGIGYAVETGDTFYWLGNPGSGGYDPSKGLNFAKVVDYATGNGNWQTVSFTVSNTSGSAQSIVIGDECYFGDGNTASTYNGAYWAYKGFQQTGNYAYAAIDNWTMTAVPEPGNLLALSTGLIGLLGAALRKRA